MKLGGCEEGAWEAEDSPADDHRHLYVRLARRARALRARCAHRARPFKPIEPLELTRPTEPTERARRPFCALDKRPRVLAPLAGLQAASPTGHTRLYRLHGSCSHHCAHDCPKCVGEVDLHGSGRVEHHCVEASLPSRRDWAPRTLPLRLV